MVLPVLDLLLRQYVRLCSDLVDAVAPQDNFAARLAGDCRYDRVLEGVRLLAQHDAGQLVQALSAWRQAANEEIKKAYGGGSGGGGGGSGGGALSLQGVCKRAAVEVLYLDAAEAVLREHRPELLEDRGYAAWVDSAQQLAFRRLLDAEEFAAGPELATLRAQVAANAARLVTALSRMRLVEVTQEFVARLEERVNPRKDVPPPPPGSPGSSPGPALGGAAALRGQLLSLCTGMRGVALSFGSDAELAASTEFLRRAHPLIYTAAVKKSQVHHALCEVLSDVLRPLVRANQPAASAAALSPALLAEWHGQVLRVKNEVGQWVNKHSKHIHEGYPLVTLLVCLVEDSQYVKQMDVMSDFLVKQMKVKEYRALCFRCLGQLIVSYLVRGRAAASAARLASSGGAAPPPGDGAVVASEEGAAAAAAAATAEAAWLDRVVRPALATARKGGLVTPAEQLDFLGELADLSPGYAVGGAVLELLQSDAPDIQTLALRLLQLVLTSIPADGAAEALDGIAGSDAAACADGAAARASITGSGSILPSRLRLSGGALGDAAAGLRGSTALAPPPGPPGPSAAVAVATATGRRMVQVSAGAALQLVRAGRHPFALQGIAHLLPKVQAALGSLFASLHRTFGHATCWSADAIPRDKGPHAALFSWVLRLLPLLEPAAWAGAPLELLPGYTAHAEASLRASAAEALHAVVQSAPALRGAVLAAVANFIGTIPDEAVQPTREATQLLRALMQLWLALLSEEGAGGSLTALAAGSPGPTAVAPGASAAAAASPGLDLALLEGTLFVLLCSYDAGVRREAYDALRVLRLLHQRLDHRRGGGGGSSGMPQGSAMVARSSDSGGTDALAGLFGGALASRVSSAHHAPSVSRDSIEFVRALGSLDSDGPSARASDTYLADVLEEVGPDVARCCYWDFGDWGDVWRESKPVPLDLSLETLMTASDDVGCLRWARCAIDLSRAAAAMCPAAMAAAYSRALARLQRRATRDTAGRAWLPLDSAGPDAWHAHLALPCVVPAALADAAEPPAGRKPGALTARNVVRALLFALSAGMPPLQHQLYLMALGHCSRDYYPLLAQELGAVIDEYQRPSSSRQRARSAGRPEEARKLVANVLRTVADSALPGAVAGQPAVARLYLDWVRDAAAFLKGVPAFGEDFWECAQVAFCLCSVVRCLVGPLAAQQPPPALPPPDGSPGAASAASGSPAGGRVAADSAALGPAERRALWELFAGWCDDGRSSEGAEYATRLSSGIASALARLRDLDPDGRDAVRAELQQCAETLDAAARGGMAALLQGPAFDTDARRAQGPVLQWIDRLLRAPGGAGAPPPAGPAGRLALLRADGDGKGSGGGGGGGGGGPPRAHVARLALGHLLRFNLDMFPVCVDRCYHPDPSIATGYFQVVSEVYALHPVPCEPHVVLSLVLYKMVDPGPEAREGTLEQLLAGWEDALRGGSSSVVVLGALQDSYQQFQYQLSAKLARDHPELSEALCEEMMTRQLECTDKVLQHPVLTCLAPWMENLSIAAHWKGTWCERLLKSMYYVTLRHGSELPLEIERLWSTLAANRRNIIPVLDFLVGLGMHVAFQELGAVLEYFSVAQRICLYLARISPQQTIDHLVYEVSLGLHEDYAATEMAFIGAGGGPRLERADSGAAFLTSGIRDGRRATLVGGGNGAVPAAARAPGGALEFASLLQELSSTVAAASAGLPGRSSGSLQIAAAAAQAAGGGPGPGRLAASLDLRFSAASGTWQVSPGGPPPPLPPGASSAAPGVSGGGSAFGADVAGAPLAGPLPATVPEDSALLSHALAQNIESETSRSSLFGGPPGGGGPGAGGGGPGPGPGDSVNSSGGWAGLGLGLTGLGMSGLGALSGLGIPVVSGLSTLGLAGLGSLAGSLGPRGGGLGPGAARISRDAPSSASWDDGSSIGLPMPPTLAGGSSTRRLTGGYAGGRSAGGGGAFGMGGGGSGLPRGVSLGDDMMAPAIRALVTRPELALCLLTEVAYEHDEDFEGHLALLLHVTALAMDSEEPLVVGAAQALMVNALYSLSARHIELRHAEGLPADVAKVTQLIQYLQSLRGRRLWPNEDPTLDRPHPPSADALGSLVDHLLAALAFQPGLRAEWCEVALEWALHCRSRHSASRSQQVLRTLAPPLTVDLYSTLLRCLLQCLGPAAALAAARETALELVLTLTALVRPLPPGRLVLFPQVLWVAAALLSSDHVAVYRRAVDLLSTCLAGLPLQDPTVQGVLLAAAPIHDANASAAVGNDAAASGAAAGAGGPGAGGDAAALIALAMQTPRRNGVDAAARDVASGHRRSFSCDARGGASSLSAAPLGAAAGPVPWGVGQLLPWLDGGPPGGVIALQQLLWKGLLFVDTSAPTARLMAELATQLSHLQGSLRAGGSGSGGAATPPRGTPGRVATPGRGAAAHSRTSSLRSSGGLGALQPEGGGGGGGSAAWPLGSRSPSGSSGSASGPRAGLLQQQASTVVADGAAAAALSQSQPAPLPPLTEQPGDGAANGGVSVGGGGAPSRLGTELGAGALSKSAPELAGIGAGDAAAVQAQQVAGGAAVGTPERRPPPQRPRHHVWGSDQALLGAPGGDAAPPAGLSTPPQLPPRAGGVKARAAAVAGGGHARSSSSSLAAAALRRPTSVRPVYQAIFGNRVAQIAATALPLIPLTCAQLAAPPAAASAAAPDLPAALRAALLTLAAACAAQGAPGLAFELEALSNAGARDLPALMPRLAAALGAALCPAYGEWLLRSAAGLLLVPGAALLHRPLLELLRRLFESPGLQLGPRAVALLEGDGGIVAPIAALAQGPLCAPALAALEAIAAFAAVHHAGADVPRRPQQQGPDAGAAAAAAAAAAEAAAGPRALVAGVLPRLDVPATLQRLLDGCAVPPKKRKFKLLPFIGGGVSDGARRTSDD